MAILNLAGGSHTPFGGGNVGGGIRVNGMAVDVTITPPLGRLHDAFARIISEIEDLTPLWDRFIPVLSRMEQERFASEGDGEWPPLAEATLRQRERLGYGDGPILQRTGALRDSLVNPAQAVHDLTPRSFSYGSDVDYARYHQGVDESGQPANYGSRPPRRVLLELNVGDRRELEAQLVGYLEELYRDSFALAA